MAQYGDENGELYGGAIVDIDDHIGDAQSRLMVPFANKTDVRNLIAIKAERWQMFDNVVTDLRTIWAIESAFGDVQDKLGAILNFSRLGFSDADYRIYQRAKAEVLIPSRRTLPGLLTLVRTLLNDDVRTIDYESFFPKAYLLTIESLTDDEQMVFLLFLSVARPTTYNGQIGVAATTNFGYADESGAVPTTTGAFGDESGAVGGGAPYSYILVI